MKIIMFTSPTCGGCKVMKPVLAALPEYEIIDVTENPVTAQQYRVRGGLPVFIKLDAKGDYDSRLDGVQPKEKFIRWATSE